MKLLHPFMPFITEEIWQHLPHTGESIMVSAWPAYDASLDFAQEEKNMSLVMEAIKSIRNTRSEMNVPPSKKCNVIVVTQLCDVFTAGIPFFEKLASAQSVAIVKDNGGIDDGAVCIVVEGASIYLPMEELVDKKKEIERLEKEKASLISEIKRVEGKLSNKGFTDKAPAAVVAAEAEKGKKYSEMLKKVEESLAALK